MKTLILIPIFIILLTIPKQSKTTEIGSDYHKRDTTILGDSINFDTTFNKIQYSKINKSIFLLQEKKTNKNIIVKLECGKKLRDYYPKKYYRIIHIHNICKK